MDKKQELCLQCFKCCRKIAFYLPITEGCLHFYRARGWKTKLIINNNCVIVYKDEICPQLTDKGCKIYKDRPIACQQYDGRKDLIIGNECLWAKEEI